MPSAKNIDEIYWPSVRIRWYVEKWAELGVTKPPGRILRDVGFKFLAALSGLTVEQVQSMNPITYATTYFHVDQNTAERKYAGESYGQLEWKAGYARSRNEQPAAEPAAAAAAETLVEMAVAQPAEQPAEQPAQQPAAAEPAAAASDFKFISDRIVPVEFHLGTLADASKNYGSRFEEPIVLMGRLAAIMARIGRSL
jgi:hypothetical protein